MAGSDRILSGQVVLPCAALDETLAFFTERLGFVVDAVVPADDPAVVVVSGHGLRLRLERDGRGDPGRLRLEATDPDGIAAGARMLTAPNGTQIEIVDAEPSLIVPPIDASFVLTRLGEHAAWGMGRAGMRYRDLIHDRLGGRFVASHIAIPEGGPVPDYVHFHKVRFQMIFCYRGWVRVVYEDQGPPFVLQAGDCVLQPPRIRHRVLEASPGLEVIEIGCPAEHETHADHGLELPNANLDPRRDFSGQRFCRHIAADATWVPWRARGFEARDVGITAATAGLAGARVVRPTAAAAVGPNAAHDGELLFMFVLDGAVTFEREGADAETLSSGDCVVVPAGLAHRLCAATPALEILEVTLPGELPTG